MANLAPALIQLREERERAKQQVERLDEAIAVLEKLTRQNHLVRRRRTARPGKRRLSAAARRRISQAQKARWAKVRSRQEKKAA